MRRAAGSVVLGLSAVGYPLTQVVIRRWGTRGAVLVESVCVGLTLRDAALILAGVPRRLRRGPALLLWLELGAGLAASFAGLLQLSRARRTNGCGPPRPPAVEGTRRLAVGLLFGLHTMRFRIYLQPGQGRA